MHIIIIRFLSRAFQSIWSRKEMTIVYKLITFKYELLKAFNSSFLLMLF